MLSLPRIVACTLGMAIVLAPCHFAAHAGDSLTQQHEVQTEPASVSTHDASALSAEEKADILMARGSYVAAIDAYQQVSPRSAIVYNKIGLAYHHMFALDEALKYYKLAVSLNPHFSEAYNNMGAVYHGKKNFALAESAYKRALKYEPGNAVTYCNLGTAYFAEHRYKPGNKAYHRAFELDPQVFHPDSSSSIEDTGSKQQRVAMAYNLAKMYASAGRKQDAIAALRKAVEGGFTDRKRLLEDKELASLRGTQEFKQFLIEEHLQ